MSKELAYVLVNPYTIRKSRTGGVIARYCARTGLKIAAARMFGMSAELVEKYAEMVRSEGDDANDWSRDLQADYVLREYPPNKDSGHAHRSLLLLFEGEDAVRKIWEATGSSTSRWGSGLTVRDTYGDYIADEDGAIKYFEPAVMAAPTVKLAGDELKLFADYSEKCGGIVEGSGDVATGEDVERTLVMLKPDNFRFASSRPGSIIDVLSASEMRIVGMKMFSMTVAQAEKFYGPVKDALKGVFASIGPARISRAISDEFGFEVTESETDDFCKSISCKFAEREFGNIVEYITGYRPEDIDESEKAAAANKSCLAVVYEGVNAVKRIRTILGPTDPSKAQPGSVRKEFGSNIMVNAAHASDSPENAKREIDIINIKQDAIKPLVDKYYA